MQNLATQTVTDDMTSVQPRKPVPRQPTLPTGTKLGRYVLVRVLGQGGFGSVYEAYDADLRRQVALKVLTRRSARANLQLLEEARALARIGHKNVVRVLDVAQIEGRVVMAMELIEGVTLQQWCAQAPRKINEVIDLTAKVADGLSAAHGVGLIHRDIKPANLLITSDDRPVLVDFGIALMGERQPCDDRTSRQRTGLRGGRHGDSVLHLVSAEPSSAVGTPAYMAPEHLRGERIDTRSDQFSLAVVMAEALTGVRPYRGETPMQLLESIERGEPDLPGADQFPAALRDLLRRGLSLDPRDRYPTMHELAVRLRQISRSHTIEEATLRMIFLVTMVLIGPALLAALTVRPLAGSVGVGMCVAVLVANRLARHFSRVSLIHHYRAEILVVPAGAIPLALMMALAAEGGAQYAFGAWLPPLLWALIIMMSIPMRRPWLSFALGIEPIVFLTGYWWVSGVQGTFETNLAPSTIGYRAAMFVTLGAVAAMVSRSLAPPVETGTLAAIGRLLRRARVVMVRAQRRLMRSAPAPKPLAPPSPARRGA